MDLYTEHADKQGRKFCATYAFVKGHSNRITTPVLSFNHIAELIFSILLTEYMGTN